MNLQKEYVNIFKISKMANIPHSSIHYLYKSGKLPKADGMLNGLYPIWKRSKIEEWLKTRNDK